MTIDSGICPAEVLFEWDGMRRDTAPSRSEGQALAYGTEGGSACPHEQAIFASQLGFAGYRETQVGATLTATGGCCGGGSETLVAFQSNAGVAVSMSVVDDLSPCLTLNCRSMAISNGGTVRRLMPVECERLQGFEDEYASV